MQLQNKILQPLTFISVEGFWEKKVHDARVAEAAEKLNEHSTAFAIATATYPPANCICFTDILLGQYTTHKLIGEYKINPARILPAYLFPQKTTYTIIDAYSNAMMIGWLCNGLSKKEHQIKARLYPVSDGFRVQQERILLLNVLSTKILEKLSIYVEVLPVNKTIVFEDVLKIDKEEAQKLEAIKKPDSVLYTGKWNGNSGTPRAFDNIDAMKTEIMKAFGIKEAMRDIVFGLPDLERILLTMILNVKKNTCTEINDCEINRICEMCSRYFYETTSEDVQIAKNNLIKYDLLAV
jgi:hypothetical protein